MPAAAGDMEGMASAGGGDGISGSLARLMEEQPLLDVVVRFNETLLRAESNERNTLISRLIEVIKVRLTAHPHVLVGQVELPGLR